MSTGRSDRSMADSSCEERGRSAPRSGPGIVEHGFREQGFLGFSRAASHEKHPTVH